MYDTLDFKSIIKESESQYAIISKITSLKKEIENNKEKILEYLEFYTKLRYLYNHKILAPEDFSKYHFFGDALKEEIDSINNKRKELRELSSQNNYQPSEIEELDDYSFVCDIIKKIEHNSLLLRLTLPKTSFVKVKNAYNKEKLIYKDYFEVYAYFVGEQIRIKEETNKNIELRQKMSYLEPSFISIDDLKKNDTKKKLYQVMLINENPKKRREIKRKAFYDFLTDKLLIDNEFLIREFMNEFDNGLLFNVKFNYLLYSLGYTDDFIEYITEEFDINNENYDEALNDLNKEEEKESKKGFTSKVISFKKKVIPKELKDKILLGLKDMIDFTPINISINGDEFEEDINIENEPIINYLKIGAEVSVKDDSYLYGRMKDLIKESNPSKSNYEYGPRTVIGVVLKVYGRLFNTNNNDHYIDLVKNGAEVVGFLAGASGNIEGYYSIKSIKRGLKR